VRAALARALPRAASARRVAHLIGGRGDAERLLRLVGRQAKVGVKVSGVDDVLVRFGKCCQPLSGERITGFITRGRGVSIHRSSCANLQRLRDADPQRLLAVDWGGSTPDRRFPVAVAIHAFDRRGLVRDISSVLADEHVNIETMNTVTSAEENTADVDLRVSVHGLDELSRLLARLSALPNVISARRRG